MGVTSEVESSVRPLNPEGIISGWVPNPGRWTRLLVKPRTQTTPTTFKTLLPGEEKMSGFTINTERDIFSTFLHTRVTVSKVTKKGTTALQREACDDIITGTDITLFLCLDL